MKITMITTVKNEENTANGFIESIIHQTKRPDEVVIVDGGSTDKTFDILKDYAKKYKWIRVYQVKGASIGKGRNYAIKNSKNEIIVVSDFGCVLDKRWLEEITKPFKDKTVDVAVGTYKPHYTNDFEYFQGLIVVPRPEKIFMSPSRMSSRSIAFKKTLWKKIGGYPDYKTGEDTEFNLRLIQSGARFKFAKKAIVYWKMRKNWKEFFTQFYNYGKGDKLNGNIRKMKKNSLFVLGFWGYVVTILYTLFVDIRITFILISLPFVYSLYFGIKIMMLSKKLKGIFYGSFLYLIKRIAYVMGVTFG